ncbi:MAG: replicative DNA helicase [Lachnospiraceae bacterium]|nr:replicative DNA helicase [Lachnospiraceae bacterium]
MAEEDNVIKRIMPHSIESEKAVLGSMLLDGTAIAAASEYISGNDFYQKQYGIIFDTMMELYNEGRPVDAVTLQERLRTKNIPEEFCSNEFLGNLVNSVPTSANAGFYAKNVGDSAILRRLIRVNEEIANSCYQHTGTTEQILGDSEKKIFDVLLKQRGSDYVPVDKIVVDVVNRIEQASKAKDRITGIRTGFYELDNYTAGLQNSDFILIAARPSMGKTAFVLNIVEQACIRDHVPTLIFSLEMPKEQIVNRLMGMSAKVNLQDMRTGNLKAQDWEKLIESAEKISQAPLVIDDTAGINITQMRTKCLKYKLEHNIGLIVVDYLQLMSGSKSNDPWQLQVSEVSRSMKAIARELKVPVIALSQLSRDVEKRTGDHKPMLSDLRDSGSIEQDADIVMFLYREDYYNKDSEKQGVTEINIAKQRNGPIGSFELLWMKEYTKFANMERQRQ